MNKIIPIVVIVAIVCGAAGFFGGAQYQKNQAGNNFEEVAGGGPGRAAGWHADSPEGVGRGQGGFVSGQITAKDDKSITVALSNGGSKIIFYSNSTQITKTAEAAAGDLEAGQNVTAQGVANGDGSVVAQSIQLRPVQTPDGSGLSENATPGPGAPEQDKIK